MKLNQFKKLEDKINNQNFNSGYKNINIMMFVLSIFGNFASIFLAYFMLSKILSGVIENNEVIVIISSLIILSGLELLKRDIFSKFSIQYLKIKEFTKDVIPLFLLSVAIIGISFYSSITGAKNFSSKTKVIENDKKEILVKYTDSLTNIYNIKISLTESEIKDSKSKIDSKDKEQTEIESVQPLSYQQRNRVRDLKTEKESLKTDISKLESDINLVKLELSDKIKSKKDELDSETSDKKKDNNSNSIAFVILSSLIEIVILTGIYFNEYYKFRSYMEFRSKIDKDPNYQKWILYDQILDVIYTQESKINQKLPSNKLMIDMCKVSDVVILPKDIINFLKVINGLGIIKTSGSSRYINKQRDISFEVLKKHFNIE